MAGDMIANRQQSFGRWHVKAAADGHRLLRDRKVITATFVRPSTPPAEVRRDLLLVGLLILAKPCIPIDAKDGLRRIGNKIRREGRHSPVYRLNQLVHWLLHLFFEDVLTWQKPIAIVIAREAAQKFDPFCRKTWKSGSQRNPLYN